MSRAQLLDRLRALGLAGGPSDGRHVSRPVSASGAVRADVSGGLCADLDEDDDEAGWIPQPPVEHLGGVSEPGRPARSWRVGVLAMLLVVLVAGGWVLRSQFARGEPVEGTATTVRGSPSAPAGSPASPTVPPEATQDAPSPSSAAAPPSPVVVTVHVVGAVQNPGVVQVSAGARVTDAVAAAGGALPEADLAAINLARQVVDGEQVMVPTPGQVVPVAPAAGAGVGAVGPGSGAGSSGAGAPAESGVVNVNTASAAELDELPGIGPVLAGRIVEWRTQNGPFASVDELRDVSGIGDRLLEQLRDRVSV
ncbi:MAG: helix-hairpin-helix domain-containing protein [Actinomycetales bacterium]